MQWPLEDSREKVVITVKPRCEKTVIGVSVQVRHKPDCTTAEDDRRGLEISVLCMRRGYRAADMRLCFRIRNKRAISRVSLEAANI